jgi:transcriptional regulator with XRE-family HTH domain
MTPHHLIQEIAQRVKTLRQTKGLRQAELSEKIGLSCRHFQKLEAGEIDFRASTLAKLARSLGVNPRLLVSSSQSDEEQDPVIKNLLTAIEMSHIGFWYVKEGKLLQTRPIGVTKTLGITLDTDVRRARELLAEHLVAEDRERFFRLISDFDEGVFPQFEFECRFLCSKKGLIWLNLLIVRDEADSKGRPIGHLGFYQDVTRWKQASLAEDSVKSIKKYSELLRQANLGEIHIPPSKRLEILSKIDGYLDSLSNTLHTR